MKRLPIILSAFILLFGVVSECFSAPKIILKLDDLSVKSSSISCKSVMDLLLQKKIQASFGIIADRCDNTAKVALTPYLTATDVNGAKLFEIWHHGLDHKNPEFGGQPYTYQKSHFEKADQDISSYVGIQMRTFGAPFNANDANTVTVLSENTNYKVSLFGRTPPESSGILNLTNRVNIETSTANPSYTAFVDNYNAKKSTFTDYMVLQAHPNGWSTDKMSQLEQVINFLLNEGCEFVTPYEYYLSLQTGDLVLDINFDNHPDAYVDYDITAADQDFDGIESRVAGEIRGLDGNKSWPQRTKVGEGCLRAHFPALMATGQKTGFLFDKGFPDTEGAIMEYRIKYSEGFQWKLGGKLPGLGGGLAYPVGCTQNINTVKNGFTTRNMWRKNGGMVVYTYFPDRDIEKCGVDYSFFSNTQPEKWYTIRQHLTLNAPGQRNGIIKMYVDDVLVFEKTDVLFRNAGRDDIKINRAIFHTYSGGSDDADWWSTEDQWIYFDDFKVWTNTSEAPETEFLVEITEPANNDIAILGEPLTLKARAMDEAGIKKVVFSINNTFHSEDSTEPFTATFTPQVEGNYTIKATAINNSDEEIDTQIIHRVLGDAFDDNFKTVFYDNFNRGQVVSPLTDGGIPATNYTTYSWCIPSVGDNGGTSRTGVFGDTDDYMLQMLGNHNGQTGNRTEVYAPLSSFDSTFKPVLNQNNGILSWRFVIKNNRNSLGGTAGFDGTNTGLAVVLAADDSNFHSQQSSKANGYAVVILKGLSGFELSLVKFKNGLSDRTVIAGPTPAFSENQTWVTARVDYNPLINEWTLCFRDDQSQTTKGDITKTIFPLVENATGLDAEFTNSSMTHFGFAINTANVGATGAMGNAMLVDDYTVKLKDMNTGNKELDQNDLQFSIYPNPSSGEFTIHTDDQINSHYTIYTANGTIIEHGTLTQNKTVNLSGKVSGLVFVKISNGNNVQTNKIWIK